MAHTNPNARTLRQVSAANAASAPVTSGSPPTVVRQQGGGYGLGDLTHKALAAVGITPERVSALLGRPCNCEQRRRCWNAITWWGVAVMMGTLKGEDRMARWAQVEQDCTADRHPQQG